jgi:hypothetical protein
MAVADLEKSPGRAPWDGAMSAPLCEALLRAWEEGEDASPGERGMILLGVAVPALAIEVSGSLTVGDRDAVLLDFFERLFGDVASALAQCPGCREELEFDIRLDDIRIAAPVDRPDHFKLAWSGCEITYRLPQARDLAALGAELGGDTLAPAARSLARRCVLAIDAADGTALAPSLLGDAAGALEEQIAAAVVDADPQAVVSLSFDCPSCARSWQSPFDIVEFLWGRIEVMARNLLRTVHLLAAHYGWGEREILSMSPRRQRHYLGLLGG